MALVAVVGACREPDAHPQTAKPTETKASGAASLPVVTSSAQAAPAVSAAPKPLTTRAPHLWPHDDKAETLEARFTAPAGFTRVPVEGGSFPAFLRSLPLARADAKVVGYHGAPLYEDGHHPNIAAVVDIDIGTKDLQQCADAVYRLHAEWRYTTSARKEISYRALSGTPIPYARYLAGERAAMSGGALKLVPGGGPRADDHAFFRSYLDDVFAWASTASLERDGKKVDFAVLEAGDAFVLTGRPFGHAVVILDVAKDASGRVALLLGQSYMPAQSIQVLRPDPTTTWFVVEPKDEEVRTPFWRPFPKTSLRRLP